MNPRKRLTASLSVGVGISRTALTLFGFEAVSS